MKTAAEISAIREEMKPKMALRYGQGDIRIVVAMGECGIASGAREVVKTVSEAIVTKGIENVTVTLSDCIGRCMEEPILTVIEKDRTTLYGNLNAEKAARIVDEHIVGGSVVSDYTI